MDVTSCMRRVLQGPGHGFAFVVAGRTVAVAYSPTTSEDETRTVTEVQAALGAGYSGRIAWTWRAAGEVVITVYKIVAGELNEARPVDPEPEEDDELWTSAT